MRVTQKQIADALGLTQATVSMALGDAPTLSRDTRDRVRKMAAEMGYSPDPVLQRLASYRKRIQPSDYRGTLAWLTNFPEREGWSRWPAFQGYFNGASKRAAELGYRLEPFWLREPNMTHARISTVLRTRGIEGILLAPQPTPDVILDLDWEDFSVLQLGYTLAVPDLHVVSRMHYRGMELVFRKLLEMGYRRPALHMPESSDLRTDHNWSAAFWSEQRNLPAEDRLPFFTEEPGTKTAASLKRFVIKYHPDVFVSISGPFYQILIKELRISVPDDMGFAFLAICLDDARYAGLSENAEEVGQAAVNFVVGMLHRDERGIPKIPARLLLEGSWVDGPTLRAQR